LYSLQSTRAFLPGETYFGEKRSVSKLCRENLPVFKGVKGTQHAGLLLNTAPSQVNFCVPIIRKVCVGFSKELHNKFLMVIMTDANPINSKSH